jgi:23S rRNA (cytosine1962-C5)-methyltransferase
VVERSEGDGRAKEGLEPAGGVVAGHLPDGPIEFREIGLDGTDWCFAVDVRRGHKTGTYLDQRDSRRTVAALARGARVLDVFSYAGGFSVAARAGGAVDVTTIDSSRPALDLAAENLRRNGHPEGTLVEADAFAHLRVLRDRAEQYDLIVLDPPKLAASESQVQRATRAYKDINLLGMKLLRPGGHLVSFSCSGAVGPELFQKVLFGAALDARRDVQIVGRLGQPSDHPVLLTFPEASYLKGLVCRVL